MKRGRSNLGLRGVIHARWFIGVRSGIILFNVFRSEKQQLGDCIQTGELARYQHGMDALNLVGVFQLLLDSHQAQQRID